MRSAPDTPRRGIRREERPGRRFWLCLFAVVTGLAFHPAARAATTEFLLSSVADGEVRFEFRSEFGRISRTDGGTLEIQDGGGGSAPLGPSLAAPLISRWIALPAASRARIAVSILETTPVFWPDGATAEEREEWRNALPQEGWSASPESWLRNQWGRSIAFCPVVADGAGGLFFVQRALFTVRYDENASRRGTAASGRDPFESFYRQIVLNYDQGRPWRRSLDQEHDRQRSARTLREGDSFSSSPNPWIKVFIPEHDVYEISGEDLDALGINLAEIELSSLRLFRPEPLPLSEDLSYLESPSWMPQVAIDVVLSAARGTGTLGMAPDDRIRFYGQGPDGWYRDFGLQEDENGRYFRDPYNQTNVYWLTWGGSFSEAPARIITEESIGAFEPYIARVQDRVHFEEDRHWDPRVKEGAGGPGGPRAPAWERFWWLALTASPADVEQVVRLAPLDPVVTDPVRVRARFWGNTTDPDPRWPDHRVRMRLNGEVIADTDRLANGGLWDGYRRRDIDTTGVWLREGEQELRLVLPGHPRTVPGASRRDQTNFAWVEMDYTRTLVAHDDSLSFRAGGLEGTHSLELSGFTSQDVVLLDASDPWRPRRIAPEVQSAGGTGAPYVARFTAGLDPEDPPLYVCRTAATVKSPSLELDARPDKGYLRARTDPAQGLIVTHRDFVAEAETLAAFRRGHLPYFTPASVEVVDAQDIMDEFSFGRTDPTALRNFLQLARDQWNGGNPEMGPAFVCLLGDAHYDYRDLLRRGAKNYVVTYEGYHDPGLVPSIYTPQFASDDFYGYLDGPEDFGLDVYLGRLPVSTVFQARTVVDKIIEYERNPVYGPWRGRTAFVADDICQGTNPDNLGWSHMRQTEAAAALIPPRVQRDKVYLYEFGSECAYDRKPAAADMLRTRINEGTLLVNFTGHGSEQQIADERVMETSSVPTLNNPRFPFLFLTASCSVGKYDFFGEGLGEALMLDPGGGAIGVFSASAIAYSGGNAEVNQEFYEAIFLGDGHGPVLPFGEGVALCKANITRPESINSRRYAFLGDPATRLGAPRFQVGLSLWDAGRQAALEDTLLRGVLTELRGRVLDDSLRLMSSFDGTAHVRIYDSAIKRAPVGSGGLVYELQGAPIYRGEVAVEDGVFSLLFQVPASLRTGDRGPAAVYAYVEDGLSDAQGALTTLQVPEIEPPLSADRVGPNIAVRFHGNPLALSPEAGFTVELEDSSGINITGLVSSRSVVMQIEEDGSLITAEDLAGGVQFDGDYRKARLQHAIPTGLQPDRAYELIVKATDNLRNSSTVRIPFAMEGGSGSTFELGGAFNFPNPTEAGTRFFGRISREAEVDVQIFTLSGRRIWRLEQPARMTPTRFAQEGIPWDGRDADGDVPANGLYLYKVSAAEPGGSQTLTTIGRLVVAR